MNCTTGGRLGRLSAFLVDEEISEGGGGRVSFAFFQRKLVWDVGEQAEVGPVLGYPGGKLAGPDVRGVVVGRVAVAGVDDHERGSGRKQAAHVGVVGLVLDEVVDNVETQR